MIRRFQGRRRTAFPRPRTAVVGMAAAAFVYSQTTHAQTPVDTTITPPVVLSHVDAVYPSTALADRHTGDVVLAVGIDKEGHVASVDVLETGGTEFDDAAKDAVRQWTFQPAKRGDRAVGSRIKIPFHFAAPGLASPSGMPTSEPTSPTPASPAASGSEPASPTPASPAASGSEPASPTPASPAASGSEPASPTPASPAASGTEPASLRAPAGAQPAAPAKDGPFSHSAATGPDEVVVHGRMMPPSRGASDFNLRIGELARVPRQNASEMLKLAPGILLTNEGGEGHGEQVFLRGFDAREGQDIEFSVGGIPINESGNLHGNGYSDTHFILPELVESLRVVEGPFDPRQGNYAVAGSANYELGLGRRGLSAKYTTGSFGTQRLLLTWGPAEANTHTFAGGELYSTNGFGRSRDAQRGSVMGQYEGRLGDHGFYRVFAQGYSTHYHSAGVIRQDDYQAGRIGFYDSYALSSYARQAVPEGGDASRYSTGASLETHLGETALTQQVFAVRRTMRLVENFTGALLDVQTPLQQIHLQRGDELDLNVDESTVGARGAARIREKVLGQTQELELGYFARADWVQGTQQRLLASRGAPYQTDTDLDSQLGDVGLYGDATLRPFFSWLSLRGGLRSDIFTFNVHDRCAVHDVSHPSATDPPIDQSCIAQQDYGRYREPDQRAATSSVALLPRVSLLVGPFYDTSLSLSYGQGARSMDPNYISQDVKTPFAGIVAYEGGLSYARTIHDMAVVARSIVFRTHVDKDLVFNEAAGRNVLGLGTTRTGWAHSVRLTGSFFDEAMNLTLVQSSYDDTGLLVAYVPNAVLRSDTAVFSDLPVHIGGQVARGALSAGITYVGPRALPYGQRSQSIFTVDTSVTLSWSHFEIGLIVSNLFDNHYRLGEYNYASDFHSQPQPTLVPERHFAAGAPRGVFGTFAVNFGGGA